MTDSDEDLVQVTNGRSLEELFPGFYPPGKPEKIEVYAHGLVSLDANALLDLYRFTEQSRNELFAVLEKVQNQLFVTNQAALEFHRDRLAVVEARLRAPQEKCDEINKPLESVIEKISEFANRHQISASARKALIDTVNLLSSNLTAAIMEIGSYDLDRQEVRDGIDPVLKRLGKILHQRVGLEPGEKERTGLIKEAERRAGLRIPPGYADRDKPPERRGGDYLVWRQLMDEAKIHGKPVLLVTNERKEDWVRKGSSGEVLGPRPELSLEMLREAGVTLHLVTVVGLLTEAKEYLGATVSESTIQEAESLPIYQPVYSSLSRSAHRQYENLSENDRSLFDGAISAIGSKLQKTGMLEIGSLIKESQGTPGLYVLRWSSDGRAMFRVEHQFGEDPGITIHVVGINRKKNFTTNSEDSIAIS